MVLYAKTLHVTKLGILRWGDYPRSWWALNGITSFPQRRRHREIWLQDRREEALWWQSGEIWWCPAAGFEGGQRGHAWSKERSSRSWTDKETQTLPQSVPGDLSPTHSVVPACWNWLGTPNPITFYILNFSWTNASIFVSENVGCSPKYLARSLWFPSM